MHILLSYPRSGNHLCRFFIELLSELPTFGCHKNKKDVEIYKNKFDKEIPFNISNYNKKDCYIKYHWPPNSNDNFDNLILIVRNPREVLLRNLNYKMVFNNKWDSFQVYFNNIDYYNNYKGKKLILFYEDILTDKVGFINILYDFLSLKNETKKKYILDNLEELFTLSLNGKNRDWRGNKSNNKLNYYYKKIPKKTKKFFDKYIDIKFKKYLFLKKKYNA